MILGSDHKSSQKWTTNGPRIRPQMIPKMDHKWSSDQTTNDPKNGPQMGLNQKRPQEEN